MTYRVWSCKIKKPTGELLWIPFFYDYFSPGISNPLNFFQLSIYPLKKWPGCYLIISPLCYKKLLISTLLSLSQPWINLLTLSSQYSFFPISGPNNHKKMFLSKNWFTYYSYGYCRLLQRQGPIIVILQEMIQITGPLRRPGLRSTGPGLLYNQAIPYIWEEALMPTIPCNTWMARPGFQDCPFVSGLSPGSSL